MVLTQELAPRTTKGVNVDQSPTMVLLMATPPQC
jgi:hypothetical protein